ncbi:FAD-dependent thymidylate synthase [Ruminococcus bromii]|jgi:thymidylate synthase (FAD)|nr:FAD-dependent thymidylate synthase [Ruminococcus bromii]MDT4342075.1 FAD-dependent thymidylate synthase [Ruminococcus bromii]
MGKITILPETTIDPISLMGRRAGICWGADITDSEKNYKRGLDCIKSNHGRAFEFVNIEAIIEGYSARVIREWYTHIGGSPTRLQSSTRYINYDNFEYIMPKTVQTKEQKAWYNNAIDTISQTLKSLEESGVKREDIAMLLPLGMTTKIVDKRNVRNVISMAEQRMCSRAYWEYRELFNEYIKQLKLYSEEWATLIPMVMKPKCDVLGYCPEKYSCGRKPQKK